LNNINQQLEKLIDENGLKAIIDTIAYICYEKEGHILENWQDKKLASTWRQDANKLLNASIRIKN